MDVIATTCAPSPLPAERPPERPPERAIRLVGVKMLARACDLTTDAVYKWKRTGLIPAEHQANVWAAARQAGAPISAAEIIGVDECGEAADGREPGSPEAGA